MQAWVRFVRKELPERLKDPAYLESLDAGLADRTGHAWLHLCDYGKDDDRLNWRAVAAGRRSRFHVA